jgi:dihydropteroate synthase
LVKRGQKRSVIARPTSIRLGTCLLKLDRPRVMGIVNCTPDSFSGDGLGGDSDKAIRLGLSLFREGADIVDIGGESTRPGAKPVAVNAELSRVIPVIEALGVARHGRISVDTMKPQVAEAALFAGATVVNDVSGLRNQKMIEVVAEHDAAVIIMHMLGEPRTMQDNPRYKDVVSDVVEFLGDRIDAAEEAGVSPRKIMVDPGIGFGKTLNHNLEIIARLHELRVLGKPIVIGVSRKSFIGKLTGSPTDERLEGSIAAAVLAVRAGADIVRVHDVGETVRALRVAVAIASATKSA